MGNGRVVFTLKREKHIQPTVPGNIPTQTRGCLRKYDHLMLERKFTEAADLVHEHGTLLGYQAMDNIRGLEFHQKALAASKKAHDKNRQARAHKWIGFHHYELEEYTEALEHYGEYLLLLKEMKGSDSRLDMAEAYVRIGCCYLDRGREIEDEEDLEMSIKKFLKSKKLLQELKVAETPRILKKKGLEKLVFDFLLYMGVAQCYLGRYDAGLKLILQSKSEAEKWKQTGWEREAHAYLAIVYDRKGDRKSSLNHSLVVYKLARQQNDVEEQSRVLLEMVETLKHLGNFDKALQYAKENQALVQYTKDKDSIDKATEVVADVNCMITQREEAEDVTKRIDAVRKERKFKAEFTLLGERGMLWRNCGKGFIQKAIEDFEAQLDIGKHIPDIKHFQLQKAHTNLGECHFELKNYEKAKTSFRAALQGFEGRTEAKIELELKLADCLRSCPTPYEQVHLAYKHVITLAKNIGSLQLELCGLEGLVATYYQFHYPDQARKCEREVKDVKRQIKEQKKTEQEEAEGEAEVEGDGEGEGEAEDELHEEEIEFINDFKQLEQEGGESQSQDNGIIEVDDDDEDLKRLKDTENIPPTETSHKVDDDVIMEDSNGTDIFPVLRKRAPRVKLLGLQEDTSDGIAIDEKDDADADSGKRKKSSKVLMSSDTEEEEEAVRSPKKKSKSKPKAKSKSTTSTTSSKSKKRTKAALVDDFIVYTDEMVDSPQDLVIDMDDHVENTEKESRLRALQEIRKKKTSLEKKKGDEKEKPRKKKKDDKVVETVVLDDDKDDAEEDEEEDYDEDYDEDVAETGSLILGVDDDEEDDSYQMEKLPPSVIDAAALEIAKAATAGLPRSSFLTTTAIKPTPAAPAKPSASSSQPEEWYDPKNNQPFVVRVSVQVAGYPLETLRVPCPAPQANNFTVETVKRQTELRYEDIHGVKPQIQKLKYDSDTLSPRDIVWHVVPKMARLVAIV